MTTMEVMFALYSPCRSQDLKAGSGFFGAANTTGCFFRGNVKRRALPKTVCSLR